MAKRREFTRDTAAEIMKRVQRPTGYQCEAKGCGLIVAKGEIHHIKQDAMETDKRPPKGVNITSCKAFHFLQASGGEKAKKII